MDERRLQQVIPQQVHDRHHVRATELDHPPGYGGTPQWHPEPIELALLAIKRDAIDELRRGDMRKECRCRQALRQQLHRDGCDPHPALAAGAGILRADVADHPHRSGLEVELLAHLLADALKGGTVGGAALLILRQIVNDIYPRQARRELLATAFAPLVSGDRNALGSTFGRPC